MKGPLNFKEKELSKDSVVATFATTAALFICFLEKNGILLCKDRTPIIGNNALVALTLIIAGKPQEKDTMIKVVLNLLK